MRLKGAIWLCRILIKHNLFLLYIKLIVLIHHFKAKRVLNSAVESYIDDIFNAVDTHLNLDHDVTQCLLRSMCVKLLLSMEGIEVAFKIGVRVSPFRAHAWIEVKGVPIKEKYEDTKSYSVIYMLN